MPAKSKSRPTLITDRATAGDEKMRKIVDEVDRFFKSVHADIEDWKFSMEDYGDGTRLFVRFQIHINQSGVSGPPESTIGRVRDPVEVRERLELASHGAGRSPADRQVAPAGSHGSDPIEMAQRADMDLASFVEQWRRKRDSNLGGEYHKDGAPFMDARSEWLGHKRSRDDVPPTLPSSPGSSKEGPKVAKTRTWAPRRGTAGTR